MEISAISDQGEQDIEVMSGLNLVLISYAMLQGLVTPV